MSCSHVAILVGRRAVLESNKHATTAAGRVSEPVQGIWEITLPTPWPIGPVNVFVIDDPLTLVDTGPIHAPTLAALEAGLAGLGYRIEDLERIVLSHQHPDHWGLAQPLATRSGAAVQGLRDLGPWLADYPASLREEDRFGDALLARHGGDPATAGGQYSLDIPFGASVEAIDPLDDGDVLEFADRRLHVLHRPGHSRSDTVFWDAGTGTLIGADHVLTRPSVPLISPPLTGTPGTVRPRALKSYRESLLRTRRLEAEVILTGHGEAIPDPSAAIDRWLSRWAAATERLRAVVDEQPRTALELATRVRGSIDASKELFAICETLGYLDELIDAGLVVEHASEAMARFSLA